jgi:tetratricopeptide (TPR) repeat protein
MRTSTAFLALSLGIAAPTLLVFAHGAVSEALAPTAARAASATPARVFEGLGRVHMPITTANPRAQTYFDQGLALAYGFNHAEAAKSFQAARDIDPSCALCAWGVALVLGPNINAPMFEEAVAPALAAVKDAAKLAETATPREQALVAALAKRYSHEPKRKQADLDARYAEAMRIVAHDYPQDDDIQVLFAESLMDLTPWAYWSKDGKAGLHTAEVVETLEKVLARNPGHIGANHFIIHAVEASPSPERALPSAERLADLAPGSGHLVHMPTHIYLRIGRYLESVRLNERAMGVDAAYLSSCGPSGVYPLAYVPHNVHFVLASAALSGQKAKAMQAADRIVAGVDETAMRDPVWGTQSQHFAAQKLFAELRFGEWQALAAHALPAPDLAYLRALTHYARGVGLARLGRPAEAQAEAQALRTIAADPNLAEILISSTNRADTVLAVAQASLDAEIKAAEGDASAALAAFASAAQAEDSLRYMEPADWPVPVRQHWGAYALSKGRAAEAQRIFTEDLQRVRENGWSLFGLSQALAAQGKGDEAAIFAQRFQAAWKQADVKL